MTWHDKVMWTEGMFLQPQHLQQADRHMEHMVDARMRGLAPFAHGFLSLSVDASAALQGRIAIVQARGILPDGTPFAIPQDDAQPAELEVPAGVRDQRVMLALALERQGVVASDAEEAAPSLPTRYRSIDVEVTDVHAPGLRQAPLRLGRLNLRLVLERERHAGDAMLGVVRILERRADGGLVLDPDYVPPTLHVGAQPVLDGHLREVLGMVRQRAASLAERLVQPGHAGVGEVADFLFLQSCNRFDPLLEHLRRLPLLAPERAYGVLLSLAGEFASYRESRRPADLPLFDPDALGPCFRAVVADIRQSMSLLPEHRAVQIDLQLRHYGVRVAMIPDVQMQRSAQFVLAVNAQMPAEAVRTRFPSHVKIGPVDVISNLVNLSLPGIPLRPLPTVPRQLPFHAGFTYFELETSGVALWRQLEANGALAIHVAGEFPGLEVEFWALRP